MMRLIIYVSLYAGNASDLERDLKNIRSLAKKRNSQNGITGVLFYENHHFLQALEGYDSVLDDLLERLHRDARHRDIQLLVDMSIAEPYFENWNMDTLNLNKVELFTAETLKKLRDAYLQNVELSDAAFITLIQEMLNTPGVEEILNR